jgi:hypothetical protein
MAKLETLEYISTRVYGKPWSELDHPQQVDLFYRKDNIGSLCSLVADRNFLDLKKNGRIEL